MTYFQLFARFGQRKMGKKSKLFGYLWIQNRVSVQSLIQNQFSMIMLVLDHVLIPNFQVQIGARLVEGKKFPEKLTFSK
jgi:hypothetical protein